MTSPRSHSQQVMESGLAPGTLPIVLGSSGPPSLPLSPDTAGASTVSSGTCDRKAVPALEELVHGGQQMGRVIPHCARQGTREDSTGAQDRGQGVHPGGGEYQSKPRMSSPKELPRQRD